MDLDELYDEFGNLIGDPLDSDAESSASLERASNYDSFLEDTHESTREGVPLEKSVVRRETIHETQTLLTNILHDTEIVSVEQENEFGEEAVIPAVQTKKLRTEIANEANEVSLEEEENKRLPQLTYSRQYMFSLMKNVPERIRNVAFVGNLHSGKTSFLDALVYLTHAPSIPERDSKKNRKYLRFTDNHKLEIEREISIKATPITLLMQDLKDKSFAINIIDTPGHPAFEDESLASLQVVEGIVLFIDVVEGLTFHDKKILSEALIQDILITVVLNKIDRLILELHLPVPDFYFKLKYILDDINDFLQNHEFASTYTKEKFMNPTNNNIIFASGELRICFDLKMFAGLYLKKFPKEDIDLDMLCSRLWGDLYYDPETHSITHTSKNGKLKRSFEYFIAEPLYKIFTYTLTSDFSGSSLGLLLKENFNIELHRALFKEDSQILLREINKRIFEQFKAFTECITSHISDPVNNVEDASTTVNSAGSSNAPLVARCSKLLEKSDASGFYALVRVYKGTLRRGMRVKILGENFANDKEDFRIETIDDLYIPGGRYKVAVQSVSKGFIGLVGGIDSIITKSATIYAASEVQGLEVFPTVNYSIHSVFKVAVESLRPSDFPKLLDGLRKINKSYLACSIKVEESGEHVVLGPGELYLDCLLHDLRYFFTNDLDLKVSDPTAKFSESCEDMSLTKIPISNNSGECSISIIAEPLADSKLQKAIARGKLDMSQPVKKTSKYLQHEFNWDVLSSRSLWSFGPDDHQYSSILMDDTVEPEVNKKLLNATRDSIELGFKWAVNEGPLCGEPIRNTKFRILDAVLSGSGVQRSSTQIIPMTRKACYTGLLTASPKLMEPVYSLHVTCINDVGFAIERLLKVRRGKVTKVTGIPGTPLSHVEGYIPVIESVGFETEVRLQTQGQAMCFLVFRTWKAVPGDPLDDEVFLPSLKPVPQQSLARDFVMKTRRRKGLNGDPTLQKYIDNALYSKLKEKGIIS